MRAGFVAPVARRQRFRSTGHPLSGLDDVIDDISHTFKNYLRDFTAKSASDIDWEKKKKKKT